MALATSEVEEIRYELGYNVLSVGAEPYISYVAVFEQVIQAFLQGGATTTSSTAVSATNGPPALVTLTLAAITTPTTPAQTPPAFYTFAPGDQVVVDVDLFQEQATIASVNVGLQTISLNLALAHAGTYPVAQQGGETVVREQLINLRYVKRDLLASRTTAGLKKFDESEFFENKGHKGGGAARIKDLQKLRDYYRDELASALGVTNLRAVRKASSMGGSPVLY